MDNKEFNYTYSASTEAAFVWWREYQVMISSSAWSGRSAAR